ncbi:MAG: UDP-2,4-diacetamido-2,4,6-trideoxy-beta-L-altropyranose hydrolase, partial [Prosthecobacter sp.]|nr:UDP-2,4-diacetamido-2,4,6-trideoxy-beta-L-altropyranose hydrolase [Prosthecobacter sp.]
MAGSTLPGTLCIRADAHASIGIGHVMRCLALAQAWQDAGGKAVFFCRPLPPALSRRLHDEGFDCHEIQHEAGTPGDILETTSACLQHSAAWLCVDGYQFSPHYRSQLKAAGAKLLVLDDLADSDLSQADAILNQNSYAVAQMYAAHAPNAHLLLGARYVLLRREFLRWRDALRLVPAYAKEVLITLGGSDPTNVTQTVMTLLGGLRSSRLHLKIILGSANPHAEPLLARLPMLREVHDADILVNPPNLPELVSLADVAITAAGSSAWELA